MRRRRSNDAAEKVSRFESVKISAQRPRYFVGQFFVFRGHPVQAARAVHFPAESSMAAGGGVASLRRQQADVSRLRLAMPGLSVEVDAPGESATGTGNRWDGSLSFAVDGFNGPRGTPYEGGRYRINVLLPAEYPIKSPSASLTPTRRGARRGRRARRRDPPLPSSSPLPRHRLRDEDHAPQRRPAERHHLPGCAELCVVAII